MKTKVTILGQEPESKKLKPIEFTHAIGIVKKNPAIQYPCNPSQWNNIKLIGKCDDLDIFLCWDDNDEKQKYIYYGHFNDGIVE